MGTEAVFDYVIAGGGTAGCILAARLSEDPEVSVLLLEAGPPDRHWTIRMPGGLRAHYKRSSRFNWHFETEPQAHMDGRRLYQPRGRTLGGSSAINGMVFLRGHAQDYQRWVQQGAAGWSYAEVLPYFKKLEACGHGEDLYRGRVGPIRVRRQDALSPLEEAFLEAGAQAGYPTTDDVNGAQQEGVCRFDMNVGDGVRSSSAEGYLRQAEHRANLTVRTGAAARRVRIEGGRALGVEFVTGRGVETARAGREVILCGGAFSSPQLLMLSGLGPADHLRAHGIAVVRDLPGVGANLHDHLEIHVQHRATGPVGLNRYLRPDRMALAGAEWLLMKRGVCARNQANTGAFLRSGPEQAHPNLQLHFFPAFFRDWTPRHDMHGYRLGTGTMRPTSRGTLRLASADPAAAPLIDVDFLATEADRREMRAAFLAARQILAQPALRPLDAGEQDPGPEDCRSAEAIDAYIRRAAGSAYHPCGTCRIGRSDDPLAVTDPAGRVHSVDGLRVCDAALMPSIVSSNLCAVVMMMAEKIADAIRGRAPLPPIDAPWGNAPERASASA